MDRVFLFSQVVVWVPRVLCVGGVVAVVFGIVLFFENRGSEHIVSQENVTTILQESSATSSGILVYVSGAVKKAGVYTLGPQEDRIFHAIEKAGGFSAQADKTYIAETLNMVGRVKDGERVYVPAVGVGEKRQEATSKEKEIVSNDTTTTVDPNTALARELDNLPGIGEQRAQRIIDHRPYVDLADFRSRSELPSSIVDTIETMLIFH